MLWTIAVILLVLWALGMVSSYTAGGLVHLLLVIAVIVVVLQFIGGRRSVYRRRGDVRDAPDLGAGPSAKLEHRLPERCSP